MSSIEEVELAEAEFQLYCLAADIGKGLVPPDARRGLTANEIAAQVNFAAIAADADRDASDIQRLLSSSRLSFAIALRQYLDQFADAPTLVRRLQELPVVGLGIIAGVSILIDSLVSRVTSRLTDSAISAGGRLRREAKLQGVDIPVLESPDIATVSMLSQQAHRISMLSYSDALRATILSVSELPSTTLHTSAIANIDTTIKGLAAGPLQSLGHQAASSAIGLGRFDAARIGPVPLKILASEILDRNTCGPCRLIDGHEYADFAALYLDYPAGIYRLCEGGWLCRGTPFIIWNEP